MSRDDDLEKIMTMIAEVCVLTGEIERLNNKIKQDSISTKNETEKTK